MSLWNSSSASSSSLASFAAFSSFCSCASLSALLRRLVPLQQPVDDRLDRRDQVALLGLRVQLDRDDAIHLEVVVVAGRVELGAQVVDEVRVGDVLQLGRLVVGLERRQDILGAVHEVEHVGRVLAGMGAIQPRERLHGLNARQPPIDVHAAQQRLVEAGLELVGDQQDLIIRRS